MTGAIREVLANFNSCNVTVSTSMDRCIYLKKSSVIIAPLTFLIVLIRNNNNDNKDNKDNKDNSIPWKHKKCRWFEILL